MAIIANTKHLRVRVSYLDCHNAVPGNKTAVFPAVFSFLYYMLKAGICRDNIKYLDLTGDTMESVPPDAPQDFIGTSAKNK